MITLFQRLLWAKKNIPSVHSPKVVVFEDPAFPNSPCRIYRPSPEMFGYLMHGGILPPIEAYHKLEYEIIQIGGHVWKGITQLEFQDMVFDFAKEGKAMSSQRVTKHRLHDEVIGSLTKDESLDYVIQKSIPDRVWSNASNSNYKNFRVVDRSEIPTDFRDRNYWRLSQDGPPIEVKLPTQIDTRNQSWGLA